MRWNKPTDLLTNDLLHWVCHFCRLTEAPYAVYPYRESTMKICWIQCGMKWIRALKRHLCTHQLPRSPLSSCKWTVFSAINASFHVRKRQVLHFLGRFYTWKENINRAHLAAHSHRAVTFTPVICQVKKKSVLRCFAELMTNRTDESSVCWCDLMTQCEMFSCHYPPFSLHTHVKVSNTKV